MIPSKSYFPLSIQERAGWYDNFNAQMQVIGSTLGFSAGELTALASDNQVMQFLATTDVTITAYDDAVRTYRKVITESNVGDKTPAFPANIVLALPVVIATGMFERLDMMVKRIRVAANYTPETGALLDIIPGAGGPTKDSLNADAPKIDATVSPGNIVNVKFIRVASDGVLIEILIDNSATWTNAGRFPKSPAEIAIPQNADHLPRNVQIRARFLAGNNPVGDWSDVVTVQTIP